MKYVLMLAIVMVVPTFFILLGISSAYHRRKARRAKSERTDL